MLVELNLEDRGRYCCYPLHEGTPVLPEVNVVNPALSSKGVGVEVHGVGARQVPVRCEECGDRNTDFGPRWADGGDACWRRRDTKRTKQKGIAVLSQPRGRPPPKVDREGGVNLAPGVYDQLVGQAEVASVCGGLQYHRW